MGAWGTGLYQDDIAMEVREYYQELLKKGISNEESLECVLEAFEEVLEDADDASPFWFALADTQWKLGRLDVYKRQPLRNAALRRNRENQWFGWSVFAVS